MNFEELQQQWQAIKSEPRSHGELRSMMYASPAWRLKKVTVKEILRFCARAFALIVLIVLFDLFGSWSSGIFAAWSIFLFLDEYLGLRYLRFLPQQATIRETLTEVLVNIRRVALVSRLAHGLIWMIVVLVLGMKVQVGVMNTVLWALMLLPVLVAVGWWSSRKWSHKMAEVKEMLEEFGEDRNASAGLYLET